VARRITSGPDCKEYGILSVICQTFAGVEFLFTVGKGNFFPVPAVDSAVFRMQFFSSVDNLENPQLFRRMVRACFNYRRKMLRNSLSRIFDKSIVYSLNSVNIDRRPENLTVEEFKVLSNELNHLIRSANA
jgi:16S rRNA (adenine1518-N6/adenine1519-N6)-dimethyltransferase